MFSSTYSETNVNFQMFFPLINLRDVTQNEYFLVMPFLSIVQSCFNSRNSYINVNFLIFFPLFSPSRGRTKRVFPYYSLLLNRAVVFSFTYFLNVNYLTFFPLINLREVIQNEHFPIFLIIYPIIPFFWIVQSRFPSPILKQTWYSWSFSLCPVSASAHKGHVLRPHAIGYYCVNVTAGSRLALGNMAFLCFSASGP